MVKYINIGERTTFKSGTSIVITIPESFVKANDIKVGDKMQVQWDGDTDLRMIAKRKSKKRKSKKTKKE